MTHSTLYWQCASYSPTNGGQYSPPHEHQLIACAGIEVTGEDDEAGLGLEANVWAVMSAEPIKPLARTLASAYNLQNFVSFYGNHFGLPLLYSTALRLGVPLMGNPTEKHTDLAQAYADVVAPAKGLTFDETVDLLGLPLGPELDIGEMWDSDDPAKQQRIPKRLIVECCHIALMEIRLRLVTGDVTQEYADEFTRTVLEAAAEKVPMIKKVFAALLSGDAPEENEPEAEPEEAEAVEPEEDFAGPTDEDDLEDDLEQEEEPKDVLEDFNDFGDLGDDDEFD